MVSWLNKTLIIPVEHATVFKDPIDKYLEALSLVSLAGPALQPAIAEVSVSVYSKL